MNENGWRLNVKKRTEETYYIKKNKKLHYDEKKEYEKEN